MPLHLMINHFPDKFERWHLFSMPVYDHKPIYLHITGVHS